MAVKAFQSGATSRPGSCMRAAPVKAVSSSHQACSGQTSGRREVLSTMVATSVFATLPALASTDVGSYLPSAGVEDFVQFTPSKSKTPAIRAGTVDPSNPYTFSLPPSWSERKVPNIQSGNYCQPRCAEPWTEVIFADDTEGKAVVLVSPLVRFTNQKDAKIEDIGDPEAFLSSVGPFITGTYLDQDDVLSMKSRKGEDGLTYYYYDVYATYGLNGPHCLTGATVKGELVLMFNVTANDKQYAKSKKKLNTMLQTFRA